MVWVTNIVSIVSLIIKPRATIRWNRIKRFIVECFFLDFEKTHLSRKRKAQRLAISQEMNTESWTGNLIKVVNIPVNNKRSKAAENPTMINL